MRFRLACARAAAFLLGFFFRSSRLANLDYSLQSSISPNQANIHTRAFGGNNRRQFSGGLSPGDPRGYWLIMADDTERCLTKFQADRDIRRGLALNRLVRMSLSGLGYPLETTPGERRVKVLFEEPPPPPPSLADQDTKFARQNWHQMSEKAKRFYLGKYPEQLSDLREGPKP